MHTTPTIDMADDEELARRVQQAESGLGGSFTQGESLTEYKRKASDVHDELARRIRALDDRTVSEDEFEAVVERLDDLERRLDEIESRR